MAHSANKIYYITYYLFCTRETITIVLWIEKFAENLPISLKEEKKYKSPSTNQLLNMHNVYLSSTRNLRQIVVSKRLLCVDK